jgi:hypothetical protein
VKYALGVLGAIIVIVLAIILIFRRTPSSEVPNAPKGTQQAVSVDDYADKDAQVAMTVDGPINAREDHRAIVITVSRTDRTLEVYQGYDRELLRRETFGNTEASYSTFVKALAETGFGLSRHSAVEDEIGACPQGRRYYYDIRENGSQVLHLWNTSCGGQIGTFGGTTGASIRQLFQKQIPGYNQLVNGVRI